LSREKAEFLLSAVIVLFLIWILWEARNWPAPSKLFPWSLGFTVLLLALVQLGVAWRAALQESRLGIPMRSEESWETGGLHREDEKHGHDASPGLLVTTSASETPLGFPDSSHRKVVTMCGWILAFFLGIWLAGFKAGSLFLTFAFLKFSANEKALISATIAAGICLFFWIVFDLALKIPLDNGVLGHYFSLN
jgi:hypothetical protein